MPERPTSRDTRSIYDVARHAKLGDAARALLHEHQTPRDYLALVDHHRLYSDGVRFAAHWLPAREALWWGCLCLWRVYRADAPVKDVSALHAVLRWVQKTSDGHRRQAKTAGDLAGLDTPAGLLALAVFYSGGSIADPGQYEIRPAPFACAQTLAGAVLLAATLAGPSELTQCQRQFLTFAHDVADGRSLWEAPIKSSK